MEDIMTLLTPEEVARVFRVDPKTVTRWAAAGRITSIRTPGGRHRRFRESDVRALLEAGDEDVQDAAAESEARQLRDPNATINRRVETRFVPLFGTAEGVLA